MTPEQRFDALIFAALDVATPGQVDALARAFPALWAQWEQPHRQRVAEHLATVTGTSVSSWHPVWCDRLDDHQAPAGCLDADGITRQSPWAKA